MIKVSNSIRMKSTMSKPKLPIIFVCTVMYKSLYLTVLSRNTSLNSTNKIKTKNKKQKTKSKTKNVHCTALLNSAKIYTALNKLKPFTTPMYIASTITNCTELYIDSTIIYCTNY